MKISVGLIAIMSRGLKPIKCFASARFGINVAQLIVYVFGQFKPDFLAVGHSFFAVVPSLVGFVSI